MSARRAFMLAGAVLLTLGTLDPAGATTRLRRLGPRELGATATAVVRGRVQDVRSFWNEGHTKILTEIVVAADETYKGAVEGSLRLMQLGGTVGNVRVTAHGALQWTPGEEVLLFVEPAAGGAYQVSGFSQGKFAVERDPRTGEAFVVAPAQGDVEMVGTPGGAETVTARLERMPLERFVAIALDRGPLPERR